MKIKHKLVKDYQYLTFDKKIILIKSGSILNNYIFKIKNEEIYIDSIIVDSNPDIFSKIEWRQELHTYIKSLKLPQPKILANKIEPFIEEFILIDSLNINDNSYYELELKKNEEKFLTLEKKLKDKELELKKNEEKFLTLEKKLKDKELELSKKDDIYSSKNKELKDKEFELSKKDEIILLKEKELIEKELKLTELNNKISEKEKYIETLTSKKSSLIDIQEKINNDIVNREKRESDLEYLEEEINKKENDLSIRESELNNKIKNFEYKIDEFREWGDEIQKLNKEIEDWESLHWKLKRHRKPPSSL